MKYRFRIADDPPASQNRHRRLRLKGRDTLRKKPLFPEPIEPIDFFEFAESEPPRKRAKHRSVLKAIARIWAKTVAGGKAILRHLRQLFRKLRRKKPPKRIHALPVLSGALCAALLVSVCSAGTVLFGLFSVYGRDYTVCRIPDFLGKTPDSVMAEAGEEDAPFNLIISYEYNPEVTPGLVIAQTPKAGVTRRLYGEDGTCTVSLVVSRRKEAYTLEPLAGSSERDACLQLRNAGLSAILTRQYSDTAPKGTVLYSIPEAGSALREGDTVTLCISLGKQALRTAVPDLFGKSEADAADRLASAGLTVGSITYQSSYYPAGTVVAQEPKAQTVLEEGATVSLTVSAGDRYTIRTVPDLYGMSTEEAAQKLREFGLIVGECYPVANASPKGTVIAQSPLPGAPITSATVEVHLYISS